MHGPNIRIIPSNTRFYGVRVADVPEVLDIVEKHLAERSQKRRPGVPPVVEGDGANDG